MNKPWLLNKIVLPQHTDHAGVMWHGSYHNWLEEARIYALSQVGLDYKQISLEGFEIPVINSQIKYISPLSLGDNVLLENYVIQGKGPRLQFQTRFLNQSNQIASTSIVDLVLISRERFTIVRKPPNHISRAFLELIEGP